MIKFFILSMLFLFGFSVKAQIWIDSGAEWHYDFSNVGYGGFERTNYIGDSLIDGQNCQRLQTVRYTFVVTGPGGEIGLLGQDTLSDQFTYSSGNRVYYRHSGEFFILYDFGAGPGDNWIISTSAAGFPWDVCDDTSRLEVIDTGSMVIAATSYKYIDLQPTGNSTRGLSGRIVERFGNSTIAYGFNSLFPMITHCDSIDESLIIEYDTYQFKCFSDDSFALYNPSGEDCEYLLTHLRIDEGTEELIGTYPNPVSDYLFIENVQGEFEIEIYNARGQLVFNEKYDEVKVIDLRNLVIGMYVARLTTNSGTQQIKIIKD